jgi:pyridoxine 4-dehydrogenase
MDSNPSAPAGDAGRIAVGGDLTVSRLGFGAMRLTGAGIWGPPMDPEQARRVLHRAVELGVDFIDTADSYGPNVSEDLIAEALFPYPDNLVVATKGGLERTGPGQWPVNGRPEHLRQACEGSLRRLRMDQIPLYQLHRPDPKVPYAESVGALVQLKDEGKIRHIGVSNVDHAQLTVAQGLTEVASVQNRYNVSDRASESIVDRCALEGIVFLPWAPIQDADSNPVVRRIVASTGSTVAQVVLAWLLARSSAMLAIPGTSSVRHLEENVAASSLRLDPEDVAALTAAGGHKRGARATVLKLIRGRGWA